jgi:leucyl-tRNA synthetase
MIGNYDCLDTHAWPAYNEELTVKNELEIVFQINGKIRAKELLPAGISKEETEKIAMNHEKIRNQIYGKKIVKVINVPGKLVNIVITG